MELNKAGADGVVPNGARSMPHDQGGHEPARNVLYDHIDPNGARHLPYDHSENRNMLGHEDPRNPYPLLNDARNNIPQEAFADRQARGTIRMST